MAKLSVHPHQGYLNTEFIIQSYSEADKMVCIYPKDKNDLNAGKPALSMFILDEGSLRKNYVFKYPGRYIIMP